MSLFEGLPVIPEVAGCKKVLDTIHMGDKPKPARGKFPDRNATIHGPTLFAPIK